jgi:hypothetical protein
MRAIAGEVPLAESVKQLSCNGAAASAEASPEESC